MNLYGFVGNYAIGNLDILGLAWPGYERNSGGEHLKCCDQKLVDKGKKQLDSRFAELLKRQDDAGVEQREPLPEEGGNGDWSCWNLNSNLLGELQGERSPVHPDGTPKSKEEREAMLRDLGLPKCWDCVIEERGRPTGVRKGLKKEYRNHWVVICSGLDSKGAVLTEAEYDLWDDRSKPGSDPDKGFRKRYPKHFGSERFLLLHKTCTGTIKY